MLPPTSEAGLKEQSSATRIGEELDTASQETLSQAWRRWSAAPNISRQEEGAAQMSNPLTCSPTLPAVPISFFSPSLPMSHTGSGVPLLPSFPRARLINKQPEQPQADLQVCAPFMPEPSPCNSEVTVVSSLHMSQWQASLYALPPVRSLLLLLLSPAKPTSRHTTQVKYSTASGPKWEALKEKATNRCANVNALPTLHPALINKPVQPADRFFSSLHAQPRGPKMRAGTNI